jgi:outer membrane protein assembly factor BamB
MARCWRAAAAVVVMMMLVAAACGWPAERFDNARTGHNALERAIGVDNVASLEPLWLATTPGAAVIAGDSVYMGVGDGLAVLSAQGIDNCAGVPKVCFPVWRAFTDAAVGYPAVGAGTVYVASASGTIYAFSAKRDLHCSGPPFVCQPLWTASIGDPAASIAVADGILYVAGEHLYALDAAGVEGCFGTPKVCQPLWTGSALPPSDEPTLGPPAIANGMVYVTAGMVLYAFDSAGVRGCSGTPKVCIPVWTARPQCLAVLPCELFNPVAYGDTVLVGADESDEFVGSGVLQAYDAAGSENCSGSPVVCRPLWEAGTGGQYADPAVANGRVYVTDYTEDDFDLSTESHLVAFDAGGQINCSGDPPLCGPVWRSLDLDVRLGAPSVANGVVYIVRSDRILAFEATGAGCDGDLGVCAPIWTSPPIGAGFPPPSPANGKLYVQGNVLRVFGLPPG